MHDHYIANTFKGQTDLSAFYIVNPTTFCIAFFPAFSFFRYWSVLRTTISVVSWVLDNMKENEKMIIHSNLNKVESLKNINITDFHWKIYSFIVRELISTNSEVVTFKSCGFWRMWRASLYEVIWYVYLVSGMRELCFKIAFFPSASGRMVMLYNAILK